MNQIDRDQRAAALSRVMKKRKVDVVLTTDPLTIRALTGVCCDEAALYVILEGKKSVEYRLITDFRYVPMVHRVAPWLEVIPFPYHRGGLRVDENVKALGIDGNHTTFAVVEQWKTFFPKARFVDLAMDLASLRAVKTVSELAIIRKAAQLNDASWQEASQQFRPGMTEIDMARMIRVQMDLRGDGEAFPTIVCVGKNAAECHHIPDETVWHGTEPILVDMGVKMNGFCSDMTRNLVPAGVSAHYREVYRLVLKANQLARKAARPGMMTDELDAIARNFLTEKGYGEAFGHSLGHGVGLEVHELPFVCTSRRMVLEPGMTVTIEPGIYIEGELGVRIEDLIVITPQGSSCLTHSPKARA